MWHAIDRKDRVWSAVILSVLLAGQAVIPCALAGVVVLAVVLLLAARWGRG